MSDRAGESRGARDAAAILPLLGVALFFPPLVYVFAAPVLVAGVPLIVVYVFGVWAALILGTFLLSRTLRHDPEEGERHPGGPEKT